MGPLVTAVYEKARAVGILGFADFVRYAPWRETDPVFERSWPGGRSQMVSRETFFGELRWPGDVSRETPFACVIPSPLIHSL